MNKVLHLYWGGKLSFLRYLTVYSFAKFNPDYKIKVYYPLKYSPNVTWGTGEQGGAYEGKDYFQDLAQYAELIPFDMETIGFSNDIPEVHKSGLIRSWILSQEGGLYCDMDIIFFKPVTIPEGTNIIQCYSGRYFSDGFLGCSEEGKPFYKNIFDLTVEFKNDRYQGMGLNVWNAFIPKKDWGNDFWNIPMTLLYSLDSFHIPDIFSDKEYKFPDDAIGCHWYGGHPLTREWENKISPDKIDYDNVICRLVREVYNG